MMLRASIDEQTGRDSSAGADEQRGALLERFVAGVVGAAAEQAERARAELADTLGAAWLIDAAAVVGNFEMMTRIADGTGARLRAEQLTAAAPIIAALGLDGFPSARR